MIVVNANPMFDYAPTNNDTDEDKLKCDDTEDSVINNDEEDASTYADTMDNDNFHLDDSDQSFDATISFFQKFDFVCDFAIFEMHTKTTVFDNNVDADNIADKNADSPLDAYNDKDVTTVIKECYWLDEDNDVMTSNGDVANNNDNATANDIYDKTHHGNNEVMMNVITNNATADNVYNKTHHANDEVTMNAVTMEHDAAYFDD
eukprot:CAMPEP_0172480028 /NCGR_PEP_ID=MMETSP1066-20121228/4917_1 /TAXON_ID=671091 /ORGANISM="Coscinodiscus wailesii, Strain CCMP2513" /LENGTH=203 /DNA_ID=CAMNT_0013240971 /DNA_START=29 /DNA_END=637 /DNA_ORIENTATION=+